MKVRVTYVKSTIGSSERHRETIRSLGLRRLNQSAVHDDTPAIRGMIARVQHLVRVEPVREE